MLRITTYDSPPLLTLLLEGRLEGPWAAELEKCWKTSLANPLKPRIRVDLTGLTFIDSAGKARLAAMHRAGAEFIAGDCLTKAVVEEITNESRPRE